MKESEHNRQTAIVDCTLEKSAQVGPGAFSAAGLRETANTRCSSFTARASERKNEGAQGHYKKANGERKGERRTERERERGPVTASCGKQKRNRALPDKKNRRDKYLKRVTQAFNELGKQVNPSSRRTSPVGCIKNAYSALLKSVRCGAT